MAKKAYILEEKDYPTKEQIPPNFHPWFECQENWDNMSQLFGKDD